MGRFRLKKGDIEVEYEGEDSDSKYEKAFAWIEGVKVAHKEVPQMRQEQSKEQSQRGGVRTGFISPGIEKLMEQHFFKLPKKKQVSEIMVALRDLGIPVKGKEEAVVNACRRRLGKGLKGTKEQGKWVFWQE